MTQKNQIVLVHSGNQFPEYIDDCITQLKKYHFEIHLILSEKLHKFLKSTDIILSSVEEYHSNDYEKFSVKRDNNYNDGFWTRTSSRFFLLREYSKKNNLTNFFHIENDVLVFDNMKKVYDVLCKTSKEMFLIIDCPNRCVPSLLWFKNSDILEDLCDFLFVNTNNDDMKNLFLFFERNLEKIETLPIIPTTHFDNNIKYSNRYSEIESIFDGAAIGQFLGGIYSDKDAVGFVNESTIFKASNYKFVWKNNEPYMLSDDKLVKILNLHIHSKDLKKFIK